MTQIEQKNAAKKFVENWNGKGYEKGESQKFWLDLLCNVFGIQDFSTFVFFENQIKDKIQDKTITNFIDVYIPSTKVMIEQKSSGKDLRKPIKQSDGSFLTPFQQAKKYIAGLPLSQHPRWVITCNFEEFLVYDMEQPNGEPESILLKDLEKEYYRLSFLTEQENIHIKKELEVSKKAGDIIGEIYDAILSQYKDAQNPSHSTLKSLNMLCVRIVFCLYAEDAGIFGHKSIFGDYLKSFEAKDLRRALLDLFQILDQKPEERDEYLEENLAAFPYVNGGLFTEEDKTIPPLTEDIKELLVKHASSEFDWSEISPTIFGAIFESTLNPETRRKGGMHYTSIENIHKVIDPLFMDELNEEFNVIASTGSATGNKSRSLSGVEGKKLSPKQRIEALHAFQEKLGNLKFLDPACGSGNFLTETYLSIRRLENKVISMLNNGEKVLGFDEFIKVKINQFYGIEINDFAVTVAKTALWIAESQMMTETEKIIGMNLDFLPLTTNAFIVEGNALRMNWETLKPIDENIQLNDGLFAGFATEVDGNEIKYDYIMGNPPFVGASMMSKEQKDEAVAIFGKIKLSNSIDYVGAWYHKAAKLIQNTSIKCAFVSTNSITQGEQVAPLWGKLLNEYKSSIDFAYRTFRWDSESTSKAHVHCVIIGFSCHTDSENLRFSKDKIIFNSDGTYIKAKNINPYLIDAPNVLIESQSKPICDVPIACKGSMPIDDGNFIFTKEQKYQLINQFPNLEKYIHRYIGAKDFLNGGDPRYVIWLDGVAPSEYRNNKEIMRRIQAVQDFRMKSTAKPTQKAAERPSVFYFISYKKQPTLVIPEVSSERRKYIPIGFLSAEIIPSNLLVTVSGATLYEFGVMTSNVHNAWMRAFAGRLESRYRYSGNTVYNTFPWATATPEQKNKIYETAQKILDVRENYPNETLACLYDPLTMPVDLQKAHKENDKAVLQLYGLSPTASETEIVGKLMEMYVAMTEGK